MCCRMNFPVGCENVSKFIFCTLVLQDLKCRSKSKTPLKCYNILQRIWYRLDASPCYQYAHNQLIIIIFSEKTLKNVTINLLEAKFFDL